MCDAPEDKSAEIAQQQERERQKAIKQGRAQVDGTLGVFDDKYYQGLTDNYVNFYNPQLDEQFGTSRDAMTKQLASSGLLGSSVAAKKFGDLNKAYTEKRGGIMSDAQSFVMDKKLGIESERARLLGQLETGMSPSDAAMQAAVTAEGAKAQPAFTPLQSVFASLLNSGSTVVGAEAQGHRGTGLKLFGGGGTRNYSVGG